MPDTKNDFDLLGAPADGGVLGDAMRSRIASSLFGAPGGSVRIGRFEVLEQLGAGGMGTVFRAWDPTLDRDVAIKVLQEHRSAPREHERLAREARALASLNHPNVVHVYEVGEHDGRVFLAMEYVAGVTVEQWLRDSTLSWRNVVENYLQAAAGLVAAHDNDITHRDFKPANVLIGNDGRVRVADFGLAGGPRFTGPTTAGDRETSSESGSLTRTGARLGTPAYMAPEQFEGVVADHRTDQFAFCVSLWEGICGRRPFDVPELESGAAGLPRPRGTDAIPRALRPILLRGLARDRSARWPGMRDLETALRDAPGRRARRIGVASAVVAATALSLVVPAASSDSRVCDLNPDLLATSLDAGGEERVEQALGQVGSAEGVATAVRRLREHSIDWKNAADQYCEVEPIEATSRCLQRVAHRFRLVVSALEGEPIGSYENLGRVLQELGKPEACLATSAMASASNEALAIVFETIDRATVLTASGRPADGLTTAQRAIESAQTADAPGAASEAYLARAQAERAMSRIDDAQSSLVEAAALALRSERSDVASRAWPRLVGLAASTRDEPKLATSWIRLAHAAVARDGNRPIALARLQRAKGELALAQGDGISAEVSFRAAVGGFRDSPRHQEQARTTRTWLANALAVQGRASEARAIYEETRSELVGLFGEEHRSVAMLELDLALLARDEGAFESMRAHARKAAEVLEVTGGARNRELVSVYNAVAEAELGLAHWEAAEEAATKSWAIAEGALELRHAERVSSLVLRGRSRLETEQWRAALEDYRAAWTQYRTNDDPRALEALFNVAWLSTEVGEFDEAEHAYRQVELTVDSESPLIPYVRCGQAVLALRRGDFEAVLEVRGLAEALSDVEGEGGELGAEISWALALALRGLGRAREEFGPYARRSRRLYDRYAPQRTERLATLAEVMR